MTTGSTALWRTITCEMKPNFLGAAPTFRHRERRLGTAPAPLPAERVGGPDRNAEVPPRLRLRHRSRSVPERRRLAKSLIPVAELKTADRNRITAHAVVGEACESTARPEGSGVRARRVSH